MRNINTEQQWPVANIWSRDPMTDDPFWPGDEDVSSLSDGGMPREDAEALRMARLHIALQDIPRFATNQAVKVIMN